MKAEVDEINGLYVIYKINNQRYMGDSTFSEILGLNKGDVLNISDERFKDLWEV